MKHPGNRYNWCCLMAAAILLVFNGCGDTTAIEMGTLDAVADKQQDTRDTHEFPDGVAVHKDGVVSDGVATDLKGDSTKDSTDIEISSNDIHLDSADIPTDVPTDFVVDAPFDTAKDSLPEANQDIHPDQSLDDTCDTYQELLDADTHDIPPDGSGCLDCTDSDSSQLTDGGDSTSDLQTDETPSDSSSDMDVLQPTDSSDASDTPPQDISLDTTMVDGGVVDGSFGEMSDASVDAFEIADSVDSEGVDTVTLPDIPWPDTDIADATNVDADAIPDSIPDIGDAGFVDSIDVVMDSSQDQTVQDTISDSVWPDLVWPPLDTSDGGDTDTNDTIDETFDAFSDTQDMMIPEETTIDISPESSQTDTTPGDSILDSAFDTGETNGCVSIPLQHVCGFEYKDYWPFLSNSQGPYPPDEPTLVELVEVLHEKGLCTDLDLDAVDPSTEALFLWGQPAAEHWFCGLKLLELRYCPGNDYTCCNHLEPISTNVRCTVPYEEDFIGYGFFFIVPKMDTVAVEYYAWNNGSVILPDCNPNDWPNPELCCLPDHPWDCDEMFDWIDPDSAFPSGSMP